MKDYLVKNVMDGDTLATIPLSDGQELRLVRMQDGLIGLGCFHRPPVADGIVIGSINDLAALATALQAVARTLGPGHGCE